MPAPNKAPGPKIKNYQIHTPALGEGSFGVVYRATYRGISDRAVKIFKPRKVDLSTVARELEKLSSVAEHPGIVTLHDFDLTADEPYYAMGLHARQTGSNTWQSRTLEDLCGHVDGRESVRLISEIADALAYLHRHQIIHCDVKPTNVLLTDETPSRIKLCDFGQSRGTGVESFEPAGTPYYASPEQLRSPHDSGEGKGFKWDVYSFGCLAYKLITGKLPRLQDLSEMVTDSIDPDATIIDASAEETLVESTTGRLEASKLADMVELNKEISWPGRISRSKTVDIELKAVIGKCLSLDPANRFADMRETAGALADIARRKTVKRAHRLIGTFAALSILALASTAFAFYQMNSARLASIAEKEARSDAEELVRFILFDLGDKLKGIDRMELLEHVASDAETYFATLANDRPTVENLQTLAALLNSKGAMAAKRGEYEVAVDQFGKAYNIATQLREEGVESPVLRGLGSESLLSLGEVHEAMGKYEEALVNFEEALTLRRETLEESGDDSLQPQRSVTLALIRIGDLHRTMNEPDKALESYEEAVVRLRQVVTTNGGRGPKGGPSGGFRPGPGGGQAGRFGQARPGLFGRGDRREPGGGYFDGKTPPQQLAVILEAIGDIHVEQGDFVEAINSYQETLTTFQRFGDTESEETTADIIFKLGDVYLALGNRVEAQIQFIEGLRLRRILVDRDPKDLDLQLNLAESYIELGQATDLEIAGSNLTALTHFNNALNLLESIEPNKNAAAASRKESLTQRVEESIEDLIGFQVGEP